MPHAADLDVLLAELRRVGDRRMAERRERRAQPAPTVAATQPAPVAKAVPAPVPKAAPAAAAVKAPTPEELLRKARALRPTQAQPAATPEERRRLLREQHQQIMRKAQEACAAGHITVLELVQLQAVRIRLDDELER